ncbi:MAG: hypothetical protein NC079_08345 [Clostridium sp.]|nr:hypothetical protein [Acetatifactor muris]MCM1527325.1 hypothetical protein [Bacteroides sp.]MCM1563604.1 hypothetical protein [Clostridium sp.]
MKKFSKMLALGMALAMTFGMTVSAAENPSVSTVDSNVSQTTLNATAVAIQESAPAGITVSGTNVAVYDVVAGAVKAVNQDGIAPEDNQAIAEAMQSVGIEVEKVNSLTVVTAFDMTGTAPADGKVTLKNVQGVEQNAKYVMMHVFVAGESVDIEFLPVVVNADGSITISGVNHFSTFALVKADVTEKEDTGDDDDDDAPAVTASGAPAAPKTGETLPVAGIMMMIALAGAAVCATKVRYNN